MVDNHCTGFCSSNCQVHEDKRNAGAFRWMRHKLLDEEKILLGLWYARFGPEAPPLRGISALAAALRV